MSISNSISLNIYSHINVYLLKIRKYVRVKGELNNENNRENKYRKKLWMNNYYDKPHIYFGSRNNIKPNYSIFNDQPSLRFFRPDTMKYGGIIKKKRNCVKEIISIITQPIVVLQFDGRKIVIEL